MRIYIAGPISNNMDYKQAFEAAADRLRNFGHTVLNPAVLPAGLPKRSYMPICLAMIDQCDAVYMLKGWESSPGARLERDYARYQGILVIGDF
jgi:nucleoside 2-deoxyribosyltransferase